MLESDQRHIPSQPSQASKASDELESAHPLLSSEEGSSSTGRASHFPRAALVGLAAGLMAVAFRESLYWAEHARSQLLHQLQRFPGWGWSVLPALGLLIGCLVGWAVARFAPDASGSGIPHVKGVLIRVRRMEWKSLLPVKFISGILGIGVGFSLGREGPTVQMGAAVAQGLAEFLRVPQRTIPQLVSCGAGAGLAAAFNAPLAGFIFVLEELRRELSALTYGGALISAVCATVVTGLLTGQAPSFSVETLSIPPLSSLPLLMLLGAAGGLAGAAFNKCILTSLSTLARFSLTPQWALAGLVGSLVGLCAWWLPEAVGGGHAVAEELLNATSRLTIGALLILFVAKLALTTMSYASGIPGGIFAPMLLMGAILGSLFGRLSGFLSLNLPEYQPAFAVLGMAAFFTSSVRAPLTGIVLILEMTGHQEYLFSLCLVCLCSYLAAEWTGQRPIYESLLEYDLVHRGLKERWPDPTRVVIAVQHGSVVERKRLRDAGFPRGCLVVNIERGGRELLPTADVELYPGDHVTVLTPGDEPERALEIVQMCITR